MVRMSGGGIHDLANSDEKRRCHEGASEREMLFRFGWFRQHDFLKRFLRRDTGFDAFWWQGRCLPQKPSDEPKFKTRFRQERLAHDSVTYLGPAATFALDRCIEPATAVLRE